jgi:phospholipid N-methyltransferase
METKAIGRQITLLRELIRNPRDMGTLCPSSRALARTMAGAVSPDAAGEGVFVEIGAGTGPVTEALLRRGVSPDRLIVVEKSPPLADLLKRRFPGVEVRCCGAEELGGLLPGGEPARAVISSLPFRSLPAGISASIMSEVEQNLSAGGLFVQFTYALLGEMPFIPASFEKIQTNYVLFNIPPAKVEVFRKRASEGTASECE